MVSLYAKKNPVQELEYHIRKEGYELLDEYKFIGKTGLKNLRSKVAKGEINRIYLYSIDHLSHKFVDQMILMKEFQKAGVDS